MGPMDLYFDVRDIFRAPRIALSGKKIWIFMVGNLGGFILYWVFSYLSLGMAWIYPVLGLFLPFLRHGWRIFF